LHLDLTWSGKTLEFATVAATTQLAKRSIATPSVGQRIVHQAPGSRQRIAVISQKLAIFMRGFIEKDLLKNGEEWVDSRKASAYCGRRFGTASE
jgi:hypothetical protein